MSETKLFVEKLNNPAGLQAKDWGFHIGYSTEGLWALELIKRKDRVWETERIISFANPYSAALAARRALARVLYFAYGAEEIDKACEKILLRDLNLLFGEFYCDFAFNGKFPDLDATQEEKSFLEALIVPLDEAE